MDIATPNRSPELISPFLYLRAHRALSALHERGIDARIFEGFRMPERQNWLYSQGRTRDGKIVTSKKGGESWHQYGLAIDIAFYTKNKNWSWSGDWDAVKEEFTKQGFQSLEFEKPHFEIHTGFSITSAKEQVIKHSLASLWKQVEQNKKLMEDNNETLIVGVSTDADKFGKK